MGKLTFTDSYNLKYYFIILFRLVILSSISYQKMIRLFQISKMF